MKPKLCRFSWMDFASTHPLMLPSTSPREALFACRPSALWSQLSFSGEFSLSFPCSRSDPRQGVAFALLDSFFFYDLVVWTYGSDRFRFGKDGSGVLAICALCRTEATLSFSSGPVYSSFSVETCAILHALCWSRQHQQVCHFSSSI